MDLDMLALRPFVLQHTAVLGFKDRTAPGQNCSVGGKCISRFSELVPNAFLAAPPRHPFFAFVIHRLASSTNKSFGRYRSHPSSATGPRFLTQAVVDWYKLQLGGLTMMCAPWLPAVVASCAHAMIVMSPLATVRRQSITAILTDGLP